MNAVESRLHRGLLFATCLIAAILLFWGLGDIPLLSYNEARRAIPAATMFASGDWLLPRLNGELYLAKPPLLYWLAAAAAHLFGTAGEWAVRLPSALAAAAIAVLVYRYALRRFGAWPALFALQLLVANAGFALFARRAEIEMLLAALCFASLLAAFRYTREGGGRGWLRLSYLLLGLAVLAKGPLALLFVTLPLLADAIYQRQPRQWQALRDPLGWAIFLVVGASWYVAVTWQMGADIWLSTVQKDMLGKMHGSTGEPVYSYLLWLLADFFPASLLLFAAPLAIWRRWKMQSASLAPMLAILVPLLIYTAFSDKHAKYLLPIYPWIAILIGLRLGEIFEAVRPATRRILLTLCLLLPAGYAVFYAAAEARVFAYRYTALQQFSVWQAASGLAPLYGYKNLDERLVYYAQRDIPSLDRQALQKLHATQTTALLLAENGAAAEALPYVDCKLREFKPYLKKKGTLTVYGLGAACAKD